MKILGIDPGLGIVGYSIVEYDGETPVLLHLIFLIFVTKYFRIQ